MSENIALMARGLVKSYGRVQALRGVDLEVRRPPSAACWT